MTMSRRVFIRVCSTAPAALMAARGRWLRFAFAPEVAAQQVVLKDLVPKGWVIGAAINQNQSDGRDTVAVDTRARLATSRMSKSPLSRGQLVRAQYTLSCYY